VVAILFVPVFPAVAADRIDFARKNDNDVRV
jgi:hypothetical protein